MTDTALKNAVAARDKMAEKIADAEDQIKEWRAKMQRAERFISDWEEFSGQKAPAPTTEGEVYLSTSKPEKKPRNPKKEDVAEAAVRIIRERGEPMTRDELFDALNAMGIIIHGKNPPVVLQTMLWRSQNQIVHLKSFGYWPTEDAYMAADHVAGGEPEAVEDAAEDPEAESLI